MKEMSNEEILEYAKKNYTIGTKFFPAHMEKSLDDNSYCIITEDSYFNMNSGGSLVSLLKNGESWSRVLNYEYGNSVWTRIIYSSSTRRWATIIKKGKSKNERNI